MAADITLILLPIPGEYRQPIPTSIVCSIWLPISGLLPASGEYLIKAAIPRDMCYEPEEIDNAPLAENGKGELPFRVTGWNTCQNSRQGI